jgi:hypothetical protein
MKIFDYKFIILLGLTLVVYFIYREVEYLRSKINKIEKDISNINISTNNTNKITQPAEMINIKSFSSETPLTSIYDEIPTKLSVESEEKVKDFLDNEPIIETLLDTTKVLPELLLDIPLIMPVIQQPLLNQSLNGLNPVKLFFNLKKELSNMELNIINDTNINSNESEPLLYNTTEKINNLIIIDEDISEQCDSIKQETPSHLAIYSNENDSCDKTNIDTLEDAQSFNEKQNFNYDGIKIESAQDNNDLVLEKLDKYKLFEIKKIAEEKKIIINKKVNGVYKPKTKNELIMEIIELKNI